MQKKNQFVSQPNQDAGALELESQKLGSEVPFISSSFAEAVGQEKPLPIQIPFQRPLLQPEHKVVSSEALINSTKNQFLNNPLFADNNPNVEANKRVYINNLAKTGVNKAQLQEISDGLTKNKKLLSESLQEIKRYETVPESNLIPEGGNAQSQEMTIRAANEFILSQQKRGNVPTELYFNAGSAYLGLNKPDEAIEMFNRTLNTLGNQADSPYGMLPQNELAKDTPITKKAFTNPASSFFGIGAALAQKGNHKEAINNYNEALKLDPENINAKKGLVYSEYKLGNKEGSAENLKQLKVLEQNAKPFEAMRGQIEEEAVAETEQQRQADYMGDIAGGLEAFVTGYDPQNKLKTLGYLNPLGKIMSGIQEGAKTIGEGVKQMGVAYVAQNEKEKLSAGLTMIEGGISTAFASMPAVTGFNAGISALKDAVSMLPEEGAKTGTEAIEGLEGIFFGSATLFANSLGYNPEQGGDMEKALHIGDVVASFAMMGGAHKALNKLTDAIKRKDVAKINEIKTEIKNAENVTIDDIKLALKKDGSELSKEVLSDIDKQAQRDVEIKQAQKNRAEGGTQDAGILNPIPASVSKTIEKMNGDKISLPSQSQLNYASNYIYSEYKRLQALKADNTRMFTTDQINESIGQLDRALTQIEEFKVKRENMSPELIAKHKELDDLNDIVDIPAVMQPVIDQLKINANEEINKLSAEAELQKEGEALKVVDENNNAENLKALEEFKKANPDNPAVINLVEQIVPKVEPIAEAPKVEVAPKVKIEPAEEKVQKAPKVPEPKVEAKTEFTPEDLENLEALEDIEKRTKEQEIEYKQLKEKQNENNPIIKAEDEAIEVAVRSGTKVELVRAIEKIDQIVNTDVIKKPIAELSTDTEAFQGRTAPYSKDSATDVIGAFKKIAFKPIEFWRNEKGKDIIIAGHSRLKALEVLTKLTKREKLTPEEQSLVDAATEKYGVTEKQIIDNAKQQGFEPGIVPKAEQFEGTKAEAEKRAIASNADTTAQTPYENSKRLSKLRSEGATKTAIEKLADELAQRGDKKYTINISHLTPNGKVAKTLEAADINPEKLGEEKNKDIREAANKTGEIMGRFPELKELHEQEIFDAIINQKIKSSEVYDKVNSVVNGLTEPFNADNKLNLEGVKDISPIEQAFLDKTNKLKSEIKDLRDSIKKGEETKLTPIEQQVLEDAIRLNKGNVEAGRKEYEGKAAQDLIKSKTDNAKALIERRQKELQDHLISKKDLAGQGAGLFDEPINDTNGKIEEEKPEYGKKIPPAEKTSGEIQGRKSVDTSQQRDDRDIGATSGVPKKFYKEYILKSSDIHIDVYDNGKITYESRVFKTRAEANKYVKEKNLTFDVDAAGASIKESKRLKYEKARQAVEDLRKATREALRKGEQNLEGLDPKKPITNSIQWEKIISDISDSIALAITKGIDVAEAIDTAIAEFKNSKFFTNLTSARAKEIREEDLRNRFNEKFEKDLKPKEEKAADSASLKKEKNIPEGLTSAQNAVITAKRKALGEEPVFKEMRQSDKELFNEVADIVSTEGKVQGLVDTAISNNRFTFTQAEQLAVLREHSVMEDQLGKLDEKVIKGDTSENLQLERNALRIQMRNYEQVLTNIGTVSGQVLRARQFFINKELTQTSIIRNMEAESKSGELPQEQIDLIDKLFKERKEAIKQREALEKKLEEKESENAMLRKATEFKEIVAKERTATRVKRSQSIEESNRNIAGLKSQLILNQRARRGGAVAQGASMATLEALIEDTPIITQIALEHVKSGVLKAEELRDRVWEDIKDIYEGITKRDVADIISGYGKQLKQNQDVDLKVLRDLKSQLRLMSGIEDVRIKGQLPVKTGLIRDAQSPDARILRQELAKAIKEEGLDTDINADPKKWRSAVQRVETSLTNQIELLDRQIADQKRIGNTPTALTPTPEIIRLRAERDAKRKALDTVLEQAGVITKETLNANKKALEKKIAELSSAIKTGTEITKEGKKAKVTDAEKEQLQASLDGLKDVYNKWYDVKNPDNKIIAKLSGNIKKINERIAEKETALREENLEKILPKVKVPQAELKTAEAKKLTEELREAKVKEGRVNLKIKQAREEWRLSQRGGLETTIDFVNDLTREFVISALTALPKIFTSGVVNQLLKPIENAIGAVTAKGFPQVSKVATIEGKYDIKTELSALGKYFDKKSWSEALMKFKTGQHSEDILYGEERHKEYRIPIGGGKYINPFVFGRSHALLKTPTYKAAYERALRYLTADAIKDPNNFEGNTLKKSVIYDIEKSAFEEGKRHVFLQPNAVAKAIRGFIYQKENSKVAAARIFAKVAKFQVQVLNVGLNFYSSQLSYVPTYAHVKALIPLIDLKMRRAMNELTPDQANYILRNMKTGNVGIGLFALGYLLPNIFGGYNKDRDDDYDVKKGDIEVGGYALPHWATHIPVFYVMQLGATLRRSLSNDETVSKLAQESVKSAIEANPFSYNARSMSGAMDSEQKLSQMLFDQTVGRLEPQLLNELAKAGDKQDGESVKRLPQNWWDMVKMKIPGLRKTVEEK